MKNGLTKTEKSLVSVINNNNLSDVIKPLKREIHLFDTSVAGTTHLKDKSVLNKIKVGDWLFLQRENNKFDSNAIIILTEDKEKLGYVPERDNLIFARLMDAGKIIKARISEIKTKDTFTQIKINIYLIDF